MNQACLNEYKSKKIGERNEPGLYFVGPTFIIRAQRG
jgi:hypothetical protein